LSIEDTQFLQITRNVSRKKGKWKRFPDDVYYRALASTLPVTSFLETFWPLLSYSDKRTAMSAKQTELLRGTLDLLILKALSLEPLHGVGISRRITQITKGAFQVSFGSLFPSLHRMEEKGWAQAEWRASENNRRAKYYRLTSTGRAQLKAEERDWNEVVKIMTAAVEST
jgi:PadR family transcriptional regulator PadR